MHLSEALRASRTRSALGYAGALPGPVADATDTTVEFVFPAIDEDGNMRVDSHEERSWGDLLPTHRVFLFALRWEPQNPKDPLTQLAETLTDWQEHDD